MIFLTEKPFKKIFRPKEVLKTNTQVLWSLVHDIKNLFSRKPGQNIKEATSVLVYRPCYFPNQNEQWLKTREWEKTSLKDYDNSTAPALAATAPYTYFSLFPKMLIQCLSPIAPLWLIERSSLGRALQQHSSSAEVCLVHGIRLELAHSECRDTG